LVPLSAPLTGDSAASDRAAECQWRDANSDVTATWLWWRLADVGVSAAI